MICECCRSSEGEYMPNERLGPQSLVPQVLIGKPEDSETGSCLAWKLLPGLTAW
jgi:hypothetical protein